LGLLRACCFTPLVAMNSYLTHVNYHFSIMSHVWTQAFSKPLDHVFFFLNLEFCDVANVAIINKMI
jgi:hypothetical protein